jgi:uncharacterized protein (TIGR02271 family)
MSLNTRNVMEFEGHTAYDPEGRRIGTIDDIFVDETTGRPEWLAVRTGLFGTRRSFVPLSGVEAQDDDVVVPWEKDLVKDAPQADRDEYLSPEEEERLYRHYGSLPGGKAGRETRGKGDSRRKGNGDDAMTRSEEELRTHTESRETGRARLRKWVETEHQTITVPVRREKIRLEREPVTDANRDAAMKGPDISEGDHEVVLREERAVVDTEVVPKERVRLAKDVEMDEERVGAEVRKERIELDDDN